MSSGSPVILTIHRRNVALLIATAGIAAATVAVILFPRALPIVALEQSISRDDALTRADSFFRAHDLAPATTRTAVRFQANDSLRTFVELAGGGHDSLNALVRGRDVAPFLWTVRAFSPGDVHEARVDFAPDGRIIGFDRRLAETDARPTLTPDSAQRLAERAIDSWLDDEIARWRFVSSSYETRKTSARVDRAFIFDRTDRRIAGAPVRMEVVVAGDVPVRARSHVEIPETFRRRYGEMRSANDLLALIAEIGILVLAIAGLVFLNRNARAHAVRWREPAIVGAMIGGLTIAAGLNEMPGSWFGYDTATSPTAFLATITFGALLEGVLIGALAAFTLACAEAATRAAFPMHLDWWKLWKYRGTTDVAARVASGYATAAIGFAYVAAFYLVTRTLFGWWVPSELLDDPNLIATPLPWMSGVAISLNAGVWEEALFRALPLSLLSLWVGQRPHRTRWMALGVVVSALVFGFAHSNYASWPPYSRGVEIFLDACFWAVLFINFGLIVTVVAHFVYDLVLFGLFAASGSATEYRVSAAIIALALLSPLLAVAWKWIAQRGLIAAPDDARFAAWTPTEEAEEIVYLVQREPHALSSRARQFAIGAIVAGVVVAIGRPSTPVLGPEFTADRARVISVADSTLRSRSADPSGWTRLTQTAGDTLAAWPRFVREHKLASRMQEIATTYHPSTWWVVRYVHTAGTTAERAEEWRVRVWPDGRVLDARHVIPDSARRVAVDTAGARAIARLALARAGVDTMRLRETELRETARPARRDVTVTYVDTAVKLPAGAIARAWVQIAGDEPLVARRGIELPESFLRLDRQRQTNRMLVLGACTLLLLGGVVLGGFFVVGRRPLLLDDGVLDRRTTIIGVAVLSVLGIVDRLNELPTTLYSYDTSEPWSSFLGTTALSFAGVVPMALLVLGAWLALNALRRRVGVPMRSSAASDMLVAGLGLGAVLSAASGIMSLASRAGIPRAPSTVLELALPFVDSVASMPSSAIVMVALAGIPILVIAGITPRWPVRALIVAVALALLVAAGSAFEPTRELDPARLLVGVAMLGVVAFALTSFGRVAACSWLVAELWMQALSGLREVVHAVVDQERVAGGLTILVACGLMALVVRFCGRASGDARQLSAGEERDNATQQRSTPCERT